MFVQFVSFAMLTFLLCEESSGLMLCAGSRLCNENNINKFVIV